MFIWERIFVSIEKIFVLRYYATFKVRKFEWLFYKINTCMQKTTTCIAGRADILSKYILHIFFQFGHCFCSSFTMLFSKAPASCSKKNLI